MAARFVPNEIKEANSDQNKQDDTGPIPPV
jgi:hypothetical protein